MTATVLRASEPRDLLAYALYTLGFRPRNSLVVICLGDRNRVVGPVARFDLPPPEPRVARDVAAVVGSVAAQARARSVVLVAFTDDDVPSWLLDAVEDHLGALGARLLDAFAVGSTRYRCLTCDGPCCPEEGWPVGELESSRVGAEMVLQGCPLLADREALAGDLSPLGRAFRREVARVASEAERRWDAAAPAERTRRRTEALRRWDGALGRPVEEVTAADAGHLVAALSDLTLRDAVILTAVPGGGHAAELLVRRPSGAGPLADVVVDALDAVFGCPDGAGATVTPDRDLALRVEALLRRLARATRGRRQARSLAVMAWLAWWTGQGARADVLLTRVEAADPGHSLAALLRTAVDGRVPPPWACLDPLPRPAC